MILHDSLMIGSSDRRNKLDSNEEIKGTEVGGLPALGSCALSPSIAHARNFGRGVCERSDPCVASRGTLNIMRRIVIGIQKGTITLTITHLCLDGGGGGRD